MHNRHLLIHSMVMLGLLGSCSTASVPTLTPENFRQQVARDIQNTYPNSEAEVYLTSLSQLSDEAILQYGDRICETLRRGGSITDITDHLRSQFSFEDQYLTHLHIMQVAEAQLCPARSFPPAGWRRSLFFLKERLNGGTPLIP